MVYTEPKIEKIPKKRGQNGKKITQDGGKVCFDGGNV